MGVNLFMTEVGRVLAGGHPAVNPKGVIPCREALQHGGHGSGLGNPDLRLLGAAPAGYGSAPSARRYREAEGVLRDAHSRWHSHAVHEACVIAVDEKADIVRDRIEKRVEPG